MAGIIHSLAIHPQCIEGIRLLKRHERIASKAEYSSAFLAIADGVTLEERLENFMETHRWGNQQIFLIIPSEEVSLGKIFPNQRNWKASRVQLRFKLKLSEETGKALGPMVLIFRGFECGDWLDFDLSGTLARLNPPTKRMCL